MSEEEWGTLSALSYHLGKAILMRPCHHLYIIHMLLVSVLCSYALMVSCLNSIHDGKSWSIVRGDIFK